MDQHSLPMVCKKPVRVLGIDLGTTNSVITEIKWKPGFKQDVTVFQIDQDTPFGPYTDILFPSVLAIHDNKVWIGEGANRMKKNPQEYPLQRNKNLFYETKLDMGISRTYGSAPDGFRNASSIASIIIKYLYEYVKKNDDTEIDYTVVTVPASFQIAQRKDTIKAAADAGINITGSNLLDEPIAALIDYLYNVGSKENIPSIDADTNILVFDFGGGTCDVAIMNIGVDKDQKSFKRSSRAVSRYHKLGGADIDTAIIYEILIPQYIEENDLEINELGYEDKKNILEPHLIGVAENLKIMMSRSIRYDRSMSEYTGISKDIRVELPQTIEIKLNGKNTLLTNPCMSLDEFDRILEPFLDEDFLYITESDYRSFTSIFSPIEDTLRSINMQKEDIGFVLLVGGSCLIPQVEDTIREYFSHAFVDLIDTEERIQTCVSRGAALNALYKAVTDSNWFEPVCHQQICINTNQGLKPLIKAGQTLPFPGDDVWAENTSLKVPKAVLTNTEDLTIEILAGVDESAKLLFSKTWKLEPILNKGEKIRLSYNMNADQVLEINLSISSHPGSDFKAVIENPITHVVNVNELQRRIMELEEWLRTNTQDPIYLFQVQELANLYAEQHKYEKAIGFYKKVIKLKNEPDALALNQLGIWYGEIKDYKNQEKFYLEAAKHSVWKGPLFNLALSFYHRKKYKEAIPLIKQAIDSEEDPAYYVLLYRVYRDLEDSELAKVNSDIALRKFGEITMGELNSFQLSWYEYLASDLKDSKLIKEIRDFQKKSHHRKSDTEVALPDASGDLEIYRED